MALMKVSEFRAQNIESRESARRKKLTLDFSRCARCGGELEFFHERLDAWHLLESGRCSCCQGKVPARRYKIC